MTDRVNNCLRERQIRRVQEDKESEASRAAAKQEETQLEPFIGDDSIIANLEGGHLMQELAEQRDGVPRRIPREWTRKRSKRTG